jgi:hypothetical protein
MTHGEYSDATPAIDAIAHRVQYLHSEGAARSHFVKGSFLGRAWTV